MASEEALLERFQPQIMYDSLEAFFCDSAAMMTDNPSTVLRAGGKALASASSTPPLGLGLLSGGPYADGSSPTEQDCLSVGGRDYRDQYVALVRARPDLRRRMYGRAQRDSDGRLWLQYWFFYFYNDYVFAAGIGLHEGDWEMVQLRVDETRDPPVPDRAVYGQHDGASYREWDEVLKPDGRPDTPLVYSGRGSHASYFEAGLYSTKAWFDIADGSRAAVDMTLEVISGGTPSWTEWPGRWGDTEKGGGPFGWLLKDVQSSSPAAPCRHVQWSDPKAWSEGATQRQRTEPPSPEGVTVRRVGNRLRVSWQFSDADAPVGIVVNVNSHDEPGVPPRTFTFDVRDEPRGSWIVPGLEVPRERTYEVLSSTVRSDGLPSAARRTWLEPESRRLRETVTGAIGHFAAVIAAKLGLLRTRLRLGSRE
jgi:hypothetical protein